jgi:UMF1 family MFS transporter
LTKRGRRLLSGLGLDRPELRAWAMYDWANSAFLCTVVTAVFPVYFRTVAGADMSPEAADFRFLCATVAGMVVSAAMSPWLGAVADASGRTKRMLGVSLGVALATTACLFFVGRGDWVLGATLFAAANVAASASFVFYDAMLPRIARPDEMDRVSSAGYALGYVGGGALLTANLVWISKPQWFGLPSGEGLTPAQATLPARLAFVSVAVWWLVFSIPLFRRVRECPPAPQDLGAPAHGLFVAAFVQLGQTWRKLRRFPNAGRMLVAFLLYNDGIGTIIRVGVLFGASVHVSQVRLMVTVVAVQFIGIPFAFAFGWIAGRFGAKRAVLGGILVYLAISALAFFMTREWHFYALALLVAAAQGGTQALSRSLFASLVPKHHAAEFFGFFGVVEKFAGIVGPGLLALVLRLTGSLNVGVLSIVPFFVVGGLVLARVDVEGGRAQARSTE